MRTGSQFNQEVKGAMNTAGIPVPQEQTDAAAIANRLENLKNLANQVKEKAWAIKRVGSDAPERAKREPPSDVSAAIMLDIEDIAGTLSEASRCLSAFV